MSGSTMRAVIALFRRATALPAGCVAALPAVRAVRGELLVFSAGSELG